MLHYMNYKFSKSLKEIEKNIGIRGNWEKEVGGLVNYEMGSPHMLQEYTEISTY